MIESTPRTVPVVYRVVDVGRHGSTKGIAERSAAA